MQVYLLNFEVTHTQPHIIHSVTSDDGAHPSVLFCEEPLTS